MIILGVFAVLAAIINIWYSYYERVENFFWNWPAYGLIAAGMFINHAYANGMMQILQATVSTYGYFIWTRHRKQGLRDALLNMVYDRHRKHLYPSVIVTTRMSLRDHFYSLLAIVVIAACIYGALSFVDDLEPFTDSFSFAILLVAAILLNHKKVESWLYYTVGDLCSMALAYMAHNWYNMVTLSLFVMLCLVCYRRWRSCMVQS